MKTTFSDVEIETVRSYWDARPCNIRHSPKEICSREFFDEVENRKYYVEYHIPKFADFKAWKGKRILEVGCGIGTDTINFARAGAYVSAVDISGVSLSIAKKRAEVFGVDSRISFYHGNTEELCKIVPLEKYDLIYSFGVLHHTPHPQQALRQIRRYMHPGTTLKLMVYYRYSWKVFWILLRSRIKGERGKADLLIAKYSEAQSGCPVTHVYSKREIVELLSDFDITRMMVDHIFPYRIPEYVNHKYKKILLFRWIPRHVFRWLEHKIGWHLCVTAKTT